MGKGANAHCERHNTEKLKNWGHFAFNLPQRLSFKSLLWFRMPSKPPPLWFSTSLFFLFPSHTCLIVSCLLHMPHLFSSQSPRTRSWTWNTLTPQLSRGCLLMFWVLIQKEYLQRGLPLPSQLNSHLWSVSITLPYFFLILDLICTWNYLVCLFNVCHLQLKDGKSIVFTIVFPFA